MSDVDLAPVEDEYEPEAVDGLETEYADTAASDETPELQILDLDQYGDALIPVKVGGEVIHKSLREIAAEGMRQGDYTRKTQDLALQRQQVEEIRQQAEFGLRLQEAWKTNPQGVLQWFQSQGLTPPVDDDPRVSTLEQRLAAMEEQALQSEIDGKLRTLANEYGDDFNEAELLRVATERNIRDLSELDDLARMVHFDALVAKAAAKEVAARKAAADAGRRSKAVESQVVSGGRSAGNVGAAPVISEARSIREMFLEEAEAAGLR
jgi:hypothetical protein